MSLPSIHISGQTPQLPDVSPTACSPSHRRCHGHPAAPSSAVSNPLSSMSPCARHPLSRPLSPDLPVRDALYVFSNFSSYMRSPHEGPDGVNSSTDFRDTVRLLDYARSLASLQSNVHILHLKYRFHGQTFQSSKPTGVYPPPGHYRDLTGHVRKAVPQPFSTVHDPVVKLDYLENGTFEPLPAQAIYMHVAKCCQPPPRVIVYSYVGSQVTQNHLSALSTWALASSPPAYVFSPLETRIREEDPLHQALHYAIPMSMYAWPAGSSPLADPDRQSFPPQNTQLPSIPGQTTCRRRQSAPTGSIPLALAVSSPQKMYPPDPVASLTVTADSYSASSTVPPPLDRIPLWALVPGVGALQGSTSASIGVKLSDFFAINLAGEYEARDRKDAERRRKVSRVYLETKPLGKQTLDEPLPKTPLASPNDQNFKVVPPVEAPARPITPSRALNATKMHPAQWAAQAAAVTKEAHLSPPTPRTPAHSRRTLSSASWPGPVSRVPGWKRGRKEQMEDVLESLGLCGDYNGVQVGAVAAQMGNLDLSNPSPEGKTEA